jgi:hypothetical protein
MASSVRSDVHQHDQCSTAGLRLGPTRFRFCAGTHPLLPLAASKTRWEPVANTACFPLAALTLRSVRSVCTQNRAWDPTLRWQYFMSADGYLRKYPAQHMDAATLVDGRVRSWCACLNACHARCHYLPLSCCGGGRYASAVTGPKDLVILLDVSYSMQRSNRYTHALEAVSAVLGTLNRDDFVNIIVVRLVNCQGDAAMSHTLSV